MENTEDRAGATSEQQDNVINTVNSLDPYGPSWQLVPGNVAAGTVYAQVPTTGTGDLTFTRASTATRTNSAGNIVDVASGVGRVHYRNADGSVSPTGRLLLEPQRTNSIRNSTMVGAVAGSPGTLPTNYTVALGGLTQTVVGTGTENGLQYIDYRLSGTASATIAQLNLEGITQIAALTGQTWTFSAYLKTISGAPNNYQLGMIERNAVGSIVKTAGQNVFPTTTLSQFVFTRALDGGVLVAFIQPLIYFRLTIGTAYDFTIRIAAPQMELGAYATTFIKTTTAAVTRVVDAASKTGASALIGQTEGTLFVELYLTRLDGMVGRGVMGLGSVNNEIFLGFTSLASNTIRFAVTTSAGTRVDFRTTVASAGTIKLAAAYKNADSTLYVNGVAATQIANTSISFSTISSLFLGQNVPGTSPLNDSVNQAALFTRRLTNAELAQITTL